MKKLFIMTIYALLASTAFAEDGMDQTAMTSDKSAAASEQKEVEQKTEIPVAKKLTWKEVETTCESMSERDRLQKPICKKAENRRRMLEEKLAYPFLSLRVFTDYNMVDLSAKDKATGAGVTLSSETDLKLSLILTQHYSRSFKTYIGGSYEYLKFDNSLSKPLLNPSANLYDFMLGLAWNPWASGSLDLSFHYGEQYYVRAYDASNLRLDEYLLPSLHAKFSQDLFSFGQLDFGVSGKIGIYKGFHASHREEVTGNYDVDTNLSYGGEIYGRKQYDDFTISGSIGYGQTQRNTNMLESSSDDMAFSIKMAFPMGFNERGR